MRGTAVLAVFAALVAIICASARSAAAQDLTLAISAPDPAVVAPSPIRIVLDLHNSGRMPVWLYKPAGNVGSTTHAAPPGFRQLEEGAPGQETTSGGSLLQAELSPVSATGKSHQSAVLRATVLLPQGMPEPSMTLVAPGKDFQESVALQIEPAPGAAAAQGFSVQGRYQLRVTYTASYSNQDDLAQHLGILLWHGEVKSNAIELEFRPGSGKCSISGTIVDRSERPWAGALVTLADADEDSIEQMWAGGDGGFSFTHLLPGRYWIAARLPDSPEDTAEFRHFDLDESHPDATAKIMMLPKLAFRSNQVLRKPVVLRVVDGNGQPLPAVRLKTVWDNGNAIVSLKGETDEDGLAALGLPSGSNYVSLKHAGCPEEDRRVDVASGPGVDGFKLDLDCSKK